MRLAWAVGIAGVVLCGCGSREPADPRVQTVGRLSGMLTPVPNPPRVDLDTRFILTLAENGRPVTDASVHLALFFKSLNQTGPTASLTPSAPGRYETPGLTTGMNGRWEARVSVTRQNQPDVELIFPFGVAK